MVKVKNVTGSTQVYAGQKVENDEKRDRKVCSLEMKAAESVGLVKLDILGLNLLDKAMEIRNLLLGISNDQ